jgi:C4-type Zn-finger protein
VDVAVSDTVFGIEYPVGARKLTVIVCDELAASVVVAKLAAHDVIDPHDGASVSGSANVPEFVTVKVIDPAAPR